MIKAVCFTNLDEYQRAEWPEHFVALPRVGDWVEARSDCNNRRYRLRIGAITHMERRGDTASWESYIMVELHN